MPCKELDTSVAVVSGPRESSKNWVLAATILGSSMECIDGTVVNVALPNLQSSLGATGAQAQWVVEAYALFISSLADRWIAGRSIRAEKNVSLWRHIVY